MLVLNKKKQVRKKKLIFKNIKKKWHKKSFSRFFKISKENRNLNLIWISYWKNLHLQYVGYIVYKLILRFFNDNGLYLNYFFFRFSHNTINIFSNNIGVFRPYNTLKLVKNFKKEILKKKRLYNIASFICDYTFTRKVVLKFGYLYLPKTFGSKNAVRFFSRYKNERFFWESLQLLSSIFKGLASSSVLGSLVVSNIRKNPRRLYFIAYIKRLLDWYYNSRSHSKIEGVRLEIKGRFNAKSRKKKHIISVGRVRIHEKSSYVDYSNYKAISKFGAIGVKVWVCPLLKKENV